MDDQKYERIMEGIKGLEIGQSVVNEKLNHLNTSQVSTNSRLDETNDNYDKLEKRVDKHDRVVGGISLAFLILGAMLKYKII